MATDIDRYNRERDKALATLDMAWAKRVMPHATNDEVRLVAMHKARYDTVSIAPDLRHQSAEYLRSRGLQAMYRPLLPPGELP